MSWDAKGYDKIEARIKEGSVNNRHHPRMGSRGGRVLEILVICMNRSFYERLILASNFLKFTELNEIPQTPTANRRRLSPRPTRRSRS